MKKNEADLVALSMAFRIGDADPQFFNVSGNGTNKADVVADFIKTLSARLQTDVDDAIHMGMIKPR